MQAFCKCQVQFDARIKPERSSNQSIDIRGLAPEKLPDRARDRQDHVSLSLNSGHLPKHGRGINGVSRRMCNETSIIEVHHLLILSTIYQALFEE